MIVFWMNCRLSAGNTWKCSRRSSMRRMKQVHEIWRMRGKSLKSWCRLSSALSSGIAWHLQWNLCRIQLSEKLNSLPNNSTCNSTLTLKCSKVSILHWHVCKPKQNKRLRFSFNWSLFLLPYISIYIQNAVECVQWHEAKCENEVDTFIRAHLFRNKICITMNAYLSIRDVWIAAFSLLRPPNLFKQAMNVAWSRSSCWQTKGFLTIRRSLFLWVWWEFREKCACCKEKKVFATLSWII